MFSQTMHSAFMAGGSHNYHLINISLRLPGQLGPSERQCLLFHDFMSMVTGSFEVLFRMFSRLRLVAAHNEKTCHVCLQCEK